MTTSKNKDNKNPVGAPLQMDGGKRRNIYLDEETYDKAREIGSGNISKGIRDAVLAYQPKS